MIGRLFPGRWVLVIYLAVLIPLTLVTRAYVTAVPRAHIEFLEQERRGIEYIRPVTALFLQITRARVSGSADLDGAMAAVDAVDAQHGRALQATRLWASWKDQARAARSRGTPSFEQYNQLTKSLTALVAQVANTSNLILDPNLDSYRLMDIVIAQHPLLLDQVGQAAQLAADSDLAADRHDLLVIARSNISRTAEAIASDLTTAFESTTDPRVKAAAAQPGAALASAVTKTLTSLAGVPAKGGQAPDVSALLASVSKLDAVSTERLDALVEARITAVNARINLTSQVLLVLSLALLLLALGRSTALRMVQRQTEELLHQALHDTLTGLANRAAFDLNMPRMLERRQPAAAYGPVLFLVDIDEFKTVNDRYGHHVGDHLLRLTAQRLTAQVRATDFVARLGGDEFAVVVDNTDVRDALVLAERITTAISQPADLGDVHLTATVSVGVYVPDETADAEQALIRADAAMYFAKATGGGYRLFDPDQHTTFIERYQLELELRAAPSLGQLVLHYQPIVDLASQRIVAVEALIRWNHPTRGLLQPDAFMTVAEESGAIIDLGQWILTRACADARRLVAGMPDDRPFTIAVNLSRRQLTSQTLSDEVSEALLAHDLPAERLTLEVTESALMHDEDALLGLLHKLKALGVELAMDDFGTGYSSMAQLRTMPIDVLKIDKVFVGGPAGESEDWAFADAIICLAHTLGKRTLAEGIEHPAQLAQLRRLGCELGQGYLFGRAMPLDEVIELLATPHQSPRVSASSVTRIGLSRGEDQAIS